MLCSSLASDLMHSDSVYKRILFVLKLCGFRLSIALASREVGAHIEQVHVRNFVYHETKLSHYDARRRL